MALEWVNLGHGLDISRDGTGCYIESMIPSWVESGAIPNRGIQGEKCTQRGRLEFCLGPGQYEMLGDGSTFQVSR